MQICPACDEYIVGGEPDAKCAECEQWFHACCMAEEDATLCQVCYDDTAAGYRAALKRSN